MPAKGSDDLFRLIKSLSPAEKGYFKKFADRYSFSEKDNNYLKLFELIDAQDTYDEKKLAKASFVNQLPRQKNYLQNLILKSLQMYDSESGIVIEIENNIQQVRALLKRGQYDICRKLLLKTKKEAIRYECFLEALKLVKFEDYLNKESGMDKSYETEKLNYVERYALAEQEKNCDEIQELEQQVIMFTRSNYSKNASLKNKLLTAHPPLLSRKAKITFYNTLSVYHNFMRNYDKQYLYSKEYIKFKKEDYEVFKGIYVFLPGYINFFFACYANKRYKECNDVTSELLRVPAKNEHEKEFQQRIYMIIKTFLFLGTGKFEQGLLFLKDTFEGKPPHKHFINPRMDAEIARNVVLIYFANKQYKNCLKLIDTLISNDAKDSVPFLYYQSLLINILIHFELGNKETTEHLIISARRTLKNNNKLTALEDLFLAFLKKYNADESRRSLISDMIGELQKIKDQENYHSHSSIYSFCLAWLESRLKAKTIQEIVAVKAKQEAGKNYWN